MILKSLIGATIANRYEIISVAGAGGMGTVFKAKQLDLERFVAIKVLDPDLVSDSQSRLRFEREAKSLSTLSHANIAAFYSYGVLDNSMPYIVMEFVEGKSLSSVIADDGAMPIHRVIRVASQIAEAVAFAHSNGIIHRDLKPANILLLEKPERDFVKLLDFGLARLEPSSQISGQKLTNTGELIGTPQYLSPEQCMGQAADARSDIYSLSCIMFEMYCGVPPFQAENPIGFIHKHVKETPVFPKKKNANEQTTALESLILKGLEKEPNDRYQTLAELSADLQKIGDANGGSGAIKLHIHKRSSLEHARRRRKNLIALAISIAILSGVAVAFRNNLMVSLAGVSLGQSPGLDNQLEWLLRADAYYKQGERLQSDAIEDAVKIAVQKHNLNPDSLSLAYQNLAAKLLEKGSDRLACRYAFLSIVALKPLSRMGMETLVKYSKQVDKSAEIILNSKQQMSKQQLNELLKIVDVLQNALSQADVSSFAEIFVQSNVNKQMPINEIVAEALICQLYTYADRNDVKNMDKHLPLALLIAGKCWGSDSPHRFSFLPTLSSRFEKSNNRPKAVALLKQYENLLQTVSPNNALLPDTWMLAAGAFKEIEDFSKVEYYANKILEASGQFRNVQSGVAHLFLGQVAWEKKDYKKAQIEASKSIEILEELQSEPTVVTNRSTAALLKGNCLVKQGQIQEAIRVVCRDLDLESKIIQFSYPHVVGIYGFIVNQYRNLGKYDKAASYAERLKHIDEKYHCFTSNERLGWEWEYCYCLLHSDNLRKAAAELQELSNMTKEDDVAFRKSVLNGYMYMVANAVETKNKELYEEFAPKLEAEFNKEIELKSWDPVSMGDTLRWLRKLKETELLKRLYHKMDEKLTEKERDSIAEQSFDVRIANLIDEEKFDLAYKTLNDYFERKIKSFPKNGDHLLDVMWNSAEYFSKHKHFLEASKIVDLCLKYQAQQPRSEAAIFELTCVQARLSLDMKDYAAASNYFKKCNKFEGINLGFELEHVWYILQAALIRFKGVGDTASYELVLDLVKRSYLSALQEGKVRSKLLPPVIKQLRDLGETKLVNELLNRQVSVESK